MGEPAIDYQKIFNENIESAISKVQNGKITDLTEHEKIAIEIYKEQYAREQQSSSQDSQKNNFENLKSQTKGAKSIIKITDTHVGAKGLEAILNNVKSQMGLLENEKIGKSEAVFHGGDLLEDFFSNSQDFSTDSIIKKGQLKDNEQSEFKSNYISFMNFHNKDILNYLTLENVDQNQVFNFFIQLFQKDQTPLGLSNVELKSFKKNKEIVKKYFNKAISNHAKKEYSDLLQVLSKHVNLENLIMVYGNHDHVDAFKEVFGKYLINPGESKEVAGINFGNVISGSTGNFFSSDFGYGFTDDMSYLGPKLIQGSKSYKDLVNTFKKNGFEYDFSDITRFYENSQKRVQLGIKSDLFDYFEKRINPELDLTVKDLKGKIPNKIPENVDVFVGHGDPSGKYAGLEEKTLNSLLYDLTKKKDVVYLHGHMHGDTTSGIQGQNGNLYYVNSGSSQNGNFARVLLDDKKSYVASLIYDIDKKGFANNRLYKRDAMTYKQKESI